MQTLSEMLSATKEIYATFDLTCPGCKDEIISKKDNSRLLIDMSSPDGDRSVHVWSNCARILIAQNCRLRDPTQAELQSVLRDDESTADSIAAAQYAVRMGIDLNEESGDFIEIPICCDGDVHITGRFIKKHGTDQKRFRESVADFSETCRIGGRALLKYPHAALLCGISGDILTIEDDYSRWMASLAFRTKMRLCDVWKESIRLTKEMNAATQMVADNF